MRKETISAQEDPGPGAGPEISVILPVHDVAGHVAAAVASLRAQDWADFEAIVIDDGSTDGSGGLARAAAGGDPRFRVVQQANRGLSAARNAGLDLARGRFVAFLDGDDRLAPQFLSRLHAALVADGGDWAACDPADCWPGGARIPRSAVLDAPPPAAPRRWPLADWPAILRHFPSAWNKLYRRDFIGGLRFDEGTWFEDHAFFQQLALKSPAILHLPEALYWQTRGRPGQITARDDERIFQQFAVLERLRAIMAGSGRPGAAPAFAQLASRLLAERSTALRDAGRRARWLAAARGWLAGQGIGFQAALSPTLAAALADEVPVTVVLTAGEGLEQSLAALAGQDIAACEILLAAPPGSGDLTARARAACPGRAVGQLEAGPGPGAWAAGAAAARGQAVVLAAAGDRFEPGALRIRADALLRAGAVLAVAGHRLPDGGWRDGWAGPGAPPAEGVVLEARPGWQPARPVLPALTFAAPALRAALAAGPVAGPLAAEALLQGVAGQGGLIRLDFPGADPAPRPAPPPGALAAAAAGLGPRGGEAFGRAVRGAIDLSFDRRRGAGRLACLLWLARAVWAARRRGLAGAADPALPRRLGRLLGLRAAG